MYTQIKIIYQGNKRFALTVISSSLAPAANALVFSSQGFSATKIRCSREKINGASGLDCMSAMRPPSHDALLK